MLIIANYAFAQLGMLKIYPEEQDNIPVNVCNDGNLGIIVFYSTIKTLKFEAVYPRNAIVNTKFLNSENCHILCVQPQKEANFSIKISADGFFAETCRIGSFEAKEKKLYAILTYVYSNQDEVKDVLREEVSTNAVSETQNDSIKIRIMTPEEEKLRIELINNTSHLRCEEGLETVLVCSSNKNLEFEVYPQNAFVNLEYKSSNNYYVLCVQPQLGTTFSVSVSIDGDLIKTYECRSLGANVTHIIQLSGESITKLIELNKEIKAIEDEIKAIDERKKAREDKKSIDNKKTKK